MHVLQLNHSSSSGGAARAAMRLHNALLALNFSSTMIVNQKRKDANSTVGPANQFINATNMLRPLASMLLSKIHGSTNPILHSYNILPSFKVSTLNRAEADIIHLHWINNEMLSIEDIGRLKKRKLWTLHDMWAFCGSEHVSYNDRWKHGYSDPNNNNDYRLDLDRWVWNRKFKCWKEPFDIVTPSNWMASCVRSSRLFSGWPVHVIPNGIETEFWTPIDKEFSKRVFAFKPNLKHILFAVNEGVDQYHKGYDILINSLDNLSQVEKKYINFIILGNFGFSGEKEVSGVKFRYLGRLQDDISLKILYNAVDCVVIPSRIDNFPNIALECMSCGIPVVGFNECGLIDIVNHNKTGYLASSFDTKDLINGIRLFTLESEGNERVGLIRQVALKNWAATKIASAYIDLYTRSETL